MSRNTQQIIKMLGSYFAFGTTCGAIVFAACLQFRIIPREQKIYDLTAQLNSIPSKIMSSTEYRQLEVQSIELKIKVKTYEEKLHDFDGLSVSNSELKAENLYLKDMLATYKDALSERSKITQSLQSKSDIVQEIVKVQSLQLEEEKRLKRLLESPRFKGTEILRVKNRIRMLQEQISALAGSLSKNA